MTVLQSLLIAVVCGISALDGYWIGEAKVREPVVTGALVGLILGDFKQGLIIGAQLELIWMGTAAIGPVAGLAVGPGGTIGTAIALATGSGVEAAMMFGVPVSILMQFMQSLIDTGWSIPMHKVDKLIDEGEKEKQIITIHWMCGVSLFAIYGLLTFVALYFGNDTINAIVNGLPEWANTGLSAVAKVLPALGFALLLNLLLDKKLIPYFVIGFCLSAYLNMSLIGVCAISFAIAFIIYIERKNKTNFALSMNVKDNSEDEGDEL
jgi:hypothetical protein